MQVKNPLVCVAVGLTLGVMSSFLGIGGGMAGRKANKKLKTAMVDKLFLGLIAVIIGISCYNAWRFLK